MAMLNLNVYMGIQHMWSKETCMWATEVVEKQFVLWRAHTLISGTHTILLTL